MFEFLENLMKYCYKLENNSPNTPYAEITIYADGSGHIEYKDERKFTFDTKEEWPRNNIELLKLLKLLEQ